MNTFMFMYSRSFRLTATLVSVSPIITNFKGHNFCSIINTLCGQKHYNFVDKLLHYVDINATLIQYYVE